MNDFLNWARKVQTNNLETVDTIRDVVSKQYGGLSDTPTPSIEDAIRSVTDEPTEPTEPTVEESVELDEAKKGKLHPIHKDKSYIRAKTKKQKQKAIDQWNLRNPQDLWVGESVEVDEKHKVGHKGTCDEVHPDETHEDWEKVKNDPRIQEAKKADFTVTAMRGSKTLESMPAEKKELNDAIKFMKAHFKGAKIVVKDSKGKTKGVYESNSIKKEYLELDNRTNQILKKVLDIS